MLHEEITGAIIGAGMTVLGALKPGLDEKLYENAMVIELKRMGRRTDQQHEFPVRYRGELIGRLIPDLIIDDAVIVDAKVVKQFNDDHIAQMLGYLAITDLEVGLLLNFKYAQLKWKRIIRSSQPMSDNAV